MKPKARKSWLPWPGLFVLMFMVAGYFSFSLLPHSRSVWKHDSVNQKDISQSNQLHLHPITIQPIPLSEKEPVSDNLLDAILLQMCPTYRVLQRGRIHFLVHALRLWGLSSVFAEEDALSGSQLLDILLDDRRYRSFYPTSGPLLLESDHGISVWVASKLEAAPHIDKCLSVCAETGVPLEHPVWTRKGSVATVQDILRDSVARFQIDQNEVEW